ncbi:MAG: hypothetical protein AMJ46_11845 [Latescibacteria bacterium DG_63]|nr:MAG: hypothetical protein AMJ46_11845 [Latescibacteria bacterium DG_63]
MKSGLHYSLLLVGVVGLFLFTGCHDEDGHYVDRTPPRAPQGVFSVTGDEQVDLYWLENCEPDLAGYRVYWNDEPTGYFHYMATTSNTFYTDTDVSNGMTYYYAVSAFDRSGNESELSEEDVRDTPRPEGFNLVLYDYNGPSSSLSGYDFSSYERQYYASVLTDIYYGYVGGEYVMFAWNPVPEWPTTDIQDAGYRELHELDWAPPDGWADNYKAALIEGHSYYVWTRTDNYAKFYVSHVEPGFVIIDWAYQTDEGNQELMKKLRTVKGDASGDPARFAQTGGTKK